MTTSPRTKRRAAILAVAIVLVLAAGLSVSALSTTVEPALTSARSGIVIDAETQEPLAGVQVVARWWHTSVNRFPPIGHGSTGGFANCLHREVAKTDNSGRYTLPAVVGAVPVESKVDLSHKDSYSWQLNAYRVGYYSPTDMGSEHVSHPPVSRSSDGTTVNVESLRLKKDNRPREERIAYLSGWGLDFSCQWVTTEPVPFVAEMYDEAFHLACMSGAPTGALTVAKLRKDARSAMPPLPKDIAQGLDELQGHYRPNEVVSPDDNVRACELLTKAKEVAQ